MPVPSSLPWMESTDAKFARALEHFQSYNEAASTFVDTVEHKLVLRHNPETGAKWLVFWDSDQIPPMRLSAVVGDVLFNLRSALDNLICGLARRKDSSVDCKPPLQFPICTSEQAFAEELRKQRIHANSLDALPIIRSVQPFLLGENSAKLHALAMLQDLNNQDKHHGVHITVGASRNTEVAMLDEQGLIIQRVKLPPNEGLGPVIVNLPPSLPDSVRVQASGSFVISFRAHELLAGRPVDEILATCLRFVELNVIDQIRPLFRPAP